MGISIHDGDSLNLYLKQVRKYRVLEKEEEIEYAKRAAQGNGKAREMLILSNLRYAVSVALRYKNFGVPLLTLINEGNMGLIRAAGKFDVSRGARFVTYAKHWIKYYVLRAIYEYSTLIRFPLKYATLLYRDDDLTQKDHDLHKLISCSHHLSLDQLMDQELNPDETRYLTERCVHDSPEEGAVKKNLREIIDDALMKLKPIEREVIIRHFGLKGQRPVTMGEIGKKYNVTKERIRQIECTALSKMRYPMTKRNVLDFIE